MKFFIKINTKINLNKIVVHYDNSFGYEKLLEDFNFQVSLNEMSSIILNFDKTDYRCTSCEGYILPNKLIKRSIYIEQYKQGGLFLHINEREKLSDFGIEYKINNNSIYYDEEKNILAIGDITEDIDIYEFGCGQYVKINDNKIIAIYIRFFIK